MDGLEVGLGAGCEEAGVVGSAACAAEAEAVPVFAVALGVAAPASAPLAVLDSPAATAVGAPASLDAPASLVAAAAVGAPASLDAPASLAAVGAPASLDAPGALDAPASPSTLAAFAVLARPTAFELPDPLNAPLGFGAFAASPKLEEAAPAAFWVSRRLLALVGIPGVLPPLTASVPEGPVPVSCGSVGGPAGVSAVPVWVELVPGVAEPGADAIAAVAGPAAVAEVVPTREMSVPPAVVVVVCAASRPAAVSPSGAPGRVAGAFDVSAGATAGGICVSAAALAPV